MSFTMTTPKASAPILSERQIRQFHTRYIKGTPDECWPWQGGSSPEGYGKVHAAKPSRDCYLAHRLAFWFHYGYWPALCVLHECDNPPCVNPLHLHEGTRRENNEERDARGRVAIGERAATTKLKPDDVRAIRQLLANGEYPVSIGRKFGVTDGAIKGIMNGKSWKWLI